MATDGSSPTRGSMAQWNQGCLFRRPELPNDNADQMRTPPPFHAGKGTDKHTDLWLQMACSHLSVWHLLTLPGSPLHKAYIDAAELEQAATSIRHGGRSLQEIYIAIDKHLQLSLLVFFNPVGSTLTLQSQLSAANTVLLLSSSQYLFCELYPINIPSSFFPVVLYDYTLVKLRVE